MEIYGQDTTDGFHRSIIETSAKQNDEPVEIDLTHKELNVSL